jgi:hypothetical protein
MKVMENRDREKQSLEFEVMEKVNNCVSWKM